jgi:hypothetical protein
VELPERVIVGGSLSIGGRSRITKLPRILRVDGDVVLDGLAIEELPEELVVGGKLRIINSRTLRSISTRWSFRGSLDLRNCTALEAIECEIPEVDLVLLGGCRSLHRLPAGMRVRRALDLSGCTAFDTPPTALRIVGLTAGWTRVGGRHRRLANLDVTNCPALHSLGDLEMIGSIEVAESGLTGMPAHLSAVTILWRGMVVTAAAAFAPESITPAMVFSEANAELRRFLMERAGPDRILAEANPLVVHADRDPGGLRRLLEVQRLRFLECRCPSTGRVYLLQVAPDTTTCHEAAARLAGFRDAAMYQPIKET